MKFLGMTLLHNLKGAMQHNHSKDTSVHVSTCISYDFNTVVVMLIRQVPVSCHKNQ
jgi:hypothetical protein